MRWVLSKRTPDITRLLLVESGPRALGEQALARLRAVFGEQTTIDALHCLEDPPVGAVECWSVRRYAGARARWRLLREIRRHRHPAVAILVGGDAIMAPWRWATLLALPAKVLIVNENADFFWLDRGNAGTLFQFLRHRSGLGGESAVRTMARFAALPFAFAYLLLYAGYVHLLRGFRLATGWRRQASN